MSESRSVPASEGASSSGVVTVVVRLLARHLERGEIVGRGEVVRTGETADLRDTSDLVRLAMGSASIADEAR